MAPLLPHTVSASDLQRNSSQIINLARSSGEPIIVIRNNKPEVAVIDLRKLQSLMNQASETSK